MAWFSRWSRKQAAERDDQDRLPETLQLHAVRHVAVVVRSPHGILGRHDPWMPDPPDRLCPGSRVDARLVAPSSRRCIHPSLF